MKKTKTLWIALAMLAVGVPAFAQLLTADRVTRNQLYPNNVQLRFGNSINGKIYSDGTDLVIDAASGTVKFPHGAAVTGSSTTTIPDNTATAYQIKEGSNNYFKVATTNSSEAVTFGNATTNPTYAFTGSGAMTVSGALTASTSFRVGTGAVIQKYLKGTATIDFPSTNAQLSADSSGITITGAVSGDLCIVGAPAGSIVNNASYSCYVSAADTAKVRLNNYSSGSVDPASGSFTVAVVHLQ